jgi:hypothetical protein
MKDLMNEDIGSLNTVLCKHNYVLDENHPQFDALLYDDFKKFINKLCSEV